MTEVGAATAKPPKVAGGDITAILYDTAEQPVAVAKVATSTLGNHNMLLEQLNLVHLSRIKSDLPFVVPEPIAFLPARAGYPAAVVMSYVSGEVYETPGELRGVQKDNFARAAGRFAVALAKPCMFLLSVPACRSHCCNHNFRPTHWMQRAAVDSGRSGASESQTNFRH